MNRLRFTQLALTVVLVSTWCLLVGSVPKAASATLTPTNGSHISSLETKTFEDLGSRALAVSGNIVVGQAQFAIAPTTAVEYAFASNLSTLTMTDLGTLPGYSTSEATAVSGNIVVGDAGDPTGNGVEAFAYDLSTSTMTDLGALPGFPNSRP